MLAEAQLDPVGSQRVAQGLAQLPGLAGQDVLCSLDQRHRSAHPRHRLRHLHPDWPAPEHDQPVRDLGESGHLAVGPDVGELVEAGYRAG